MAQGRINFTVGFNVDQSGLAQLKSSLIGLQNLTPKEIIGAASAKDAQVKLKEVQQTAQKVGEILQASMNPALNTVNIDQFKQKLNDSGLTLAKIRTEFAAVGAQGTAAFRDLTTAITSVKLPLQESHNLLRSMGQTLMNTIKWTVASSAINTVSGSIQKAWSYTKELDKSLNNIMLVTDKSADSMSEFARQANKAAKELGKSTTDYTNAALIYYQQGLAEPEVQARTETTLKVANVTKQSTDAVSEQLTAVWNGYKVSAQEAELYVDKLSAVAATTAADLEELSTGMSKVASAANGMGVDIDQLNAMLATTISVTRQAPESVGTAFKTIFARISDIEAGQDTETTLGEYTAQMAQMGFNVLDANGKLKDMGEVVEEIGSKWNTLSREQQVSLAQTMAGTRQYNNLLALFENWSMYEAAMKTSINAAGTLQKQQDEYMQSVEAHLEQLSTAGERVYDALLDPENINPIIDLLTGAVDLFGTFVESIGGGGTLLMALVPIMTKLFSGTIASGVSTFVTNLQNSKNSAESLKGVLESIQEIRLRGEQFDEFDKKVLDLRENLILLKQQGIITNEEFNNLSSSVDAFANSITKVEQARQAYSGEGLSKKYNDFMMTAGNMQQVGNETAIKNLNTIADYGKNTFEQSNQTPADFINFLNSDQAKLGGEQVTEAWGKVNKQINDVTTSLQKASEKTLQLAKTVEKPVKNVEKLQGQINKTIQTTESLAKSRFIGSEAKSELTKAVKILKQFESGERDATKEASELQKAANTVARITKSGFTNASAAAKELTTTLESSVTGAFNKAEAEANAFGIAAENAFKKANLEARINQFIQLASNVGMAASALQTLVNIGDIWSREDLTVGEKILQTIMNLSSATGMLLPIILAASKAYKDKAASMMTTNAQSFAEANLTVILTTLKNKDADATTKQAAARLLLDMASDEISDDLREECLLHLANGEALDAETIAILKNAAAKKIANNTDFKPNLGDVGKDVLKGFKGKVKTGWSKLKTAGTTGAGKVASVAGGVVAGGILGALAGNALIQQADNVEENALIKEKDKANALTVALNEVQAAYDNITSSIDNLSSMKESLDDLTVGTVEWKKAISDINNEVYTLIEQYPELASAVTTGANGVLSIREDALIALQEEQLDQIQASTSAKMAQTAKTSRAESNLAQNELSEQMTYGSEAGEAWAEEGGAAAAGIAGAVAGGLTTGAVIGAVGGPLGVAIGAAVGLVAGAITGAVAAGAQEAAENANAERLDNFVKTEDFQQIINLYREDSKVFESEEALRVALEQNGIILDTASEALVSELIGTQEGLAKFKEFVDKKSQEDIANYNARIEAGAQIVGVDASEAEKLLAGGEAKNRAAKIRDEVKKELEGGNEADAAAAKEAFDALGWDYDSIGFQGANKVQRLDEEGNVIEEYDIETIYDLIAEQRAVTELQAEEWSANISAIDHIDEDIMNATVKSAAQKADFTHLKIGEINQAVAIDSEKWTKEEEETYRKLAESNGKTLEQFKANLVEGQKDAIIALDSLWTNIPAEVKTKLDTLDWNMDELSLPIADKFINAYSNLYTAGGSELTNKLDMVIQEAGSLSDELITELMNQDWSAIEDPETVIDTILKNSGTENLSEDAKNSLTDIVRVSSNKVKDLKTLQSEYAEIQGLIEKATMGASWSADEYNRLNKEQQKYFTVMADGTALLLQDAYLLKNQLKNAASDNAYDELENAIAAHKKAGADVEKAIADVISSEQYTHILTTQGDKAAREYLQAQIQDKVKIADESRKPVLDNALQYMRTLGSTEEVDEFWNSFKQMLFPNWELMEEDSTEFYYGLTKTEILDAIGNAKESVRLSNLASSLGKSVEETAELYDAFDGDEAAIRKHVKALDQTSTALEKQRQATEKLTKDFELLSDASKLTNIGALRTAQRTEVNKLKQNVTSEANVLRVKFTDVQGQFEELTGSTSLLAGFELYGKNLDEWDTIRQNYLAEGDHSQAENDAFWQMDEYVAQYRKLHEGKLEQIDEINQEILDLNLQEFELKISTKIDKISAQEAFNDFQHNFIDKTDFTALINFDLQNFDQTLQKFKIYKQALADLKKYTVVTDLSAYEGKEITSKKIISDADYQAKKLEIINKLMEEGVNLQEVKNSLEETYLDYQEQVAAAYERQVELIEYANKAIEHQKTMIELMYGSEAKKHMTDYYQTRYNNAEKVEQQLKAQYEQDKADYEAMRDAESGIYTQEQIDAITSQYAASTDAYLGAVNDLALARQEQYIHESTLLLEEFDKKLTTIGGEKAKEEWDWMQAEADDFLDSLDAAFGIESIANSYTKAANATTDIKTQQKINELKNKELEILQSKDKLTQYDLDRAQKQLDILQARIALEDAQQSKTEMRLVRSASGTYSYQYVADQNAIDEAREKLNQAQQDLVNLDEEQLKSNVEKVYDIYSEMMQKLTELIDSGASETEISAVANKYLERMESIGAGVTGLMDNIQASVQMASGSLGLGENINAIFPWLDSNWMQTVLDSSATGWQSVFDTTLESLLEKLRTYESDRDTIYDKTKEGTSYGFDKVVDDFIWNIDEKMIPAQDKVIDKLNGFSSEMKTLVEETLPGLRTIISEIKEEIDTTVTTENFANKIPTEWTITITRDAETNDVTGYDMKAASAATGMYTGEWGPEGKLAILHEKELVLNKQDTANILSAVDLVRSLGDSMMNTLAFLGSGDVVSAAAWELAKELIIEQTVNIKAEFPNATDKAEIEAAFEELVGLATQHAYENKRG